MQLVYCFFSLASSDPENYQRLYEKSIQLGSVDLQSTDSIIVGVAGSGKTHSLAMALNEELPVKRTSTPCAKSPVRTIAQTRISMKDGVLNRVKHDGYFATVMHTAKCVAHSIPTPLPIRKTGMSATPNYMRKLEEEMIRHVKDGTHSDHLLYKSHWNKLTDIGGQPQFLEILPIFIHHISLGIFTIKLNERLSDHPMIEYYDEGKPVGKPYRSCYSHEQIIRHFMRALIS